jgi:hypothetical protein
MIFSGSKVVEEREIAHSSVTKKGNWGPGSAVSERPEMAKFQRS